MKIHASALNITSVWHDIRATQSMIEPTDFDD
jgi:hypothetical protein